MRYWPSGEWFISSILLLLMGSVLSTDLLPQTPAESVAEAGGNRHRQDQALSGTPTTTTDVDPQVLPIIDEMTAAGVIHPKTLGQARRAYLFYTKFDSSPESVFRISDRNILTTSGSVPIRLYSPNASRALPMLVFFHGGGFVTGSLDSHDVPLRAVANRCNCLVISVAYRLAPENPFPAAPDDCYTATKWVADHASEIGGDPHRIAVGGDGAGGNLAAVVALIAHDRGLPHILHQVLIYPILDAAMSTYSWIESVDPVLTDSVMRLKWVEYLPIGTKLSDPYVSPVDARNFRNLPPALIITTANDPSRDEAKYYADVLTNAGVPVEMSRYPSLIHGFFLMSGQLNAGRQLINQVAADLRQVFQNAQVNPEPGSKTGEGN